VRVASDDIGSYASLVYRRNPKSTGGYSIRQIPALLSIPRVGFDIYSSPYIMYMHDFWRVLMHMYMQLQAG